MAAVGDVGALPEPSGSSDLSGVGRSFSALMAGELANKMLRFGAAAVLARGLSPREYGLFNVGIAFSGILVVLTTFGLPEVVGRIVANEPAEAGRLGGMVATARVTATLVVGVIGLVVMEIVWPGHFLFGAAIVVMAAAMSATADWLGRALERMRLVAAGAAAGGVVALAGSIVVTLTTGSAAAGLAVFVAAEMAATAVYWTAVRRRDVRLGVAGLRPIMRRAWPVALSSAAIYSYYANLDTIIMAAARSESEAGVYSAAYRLYLTICIVGVFAAYAAFPRLSRSTGLDRIEVLVTRLRPTLAYLVGYGLVVVGVATLIGEELLQVLFGARFGAAADTLTLLCVSAAWYCVGFPIGYNLVAAERNRRFLAGALAGAGLNLALDLILIPEYGLIGAGVATTVGSIGAMATWLGVRGVTSRAARPVLLALVAVAAVALTGLRLDGARIPAGALLAVAGTIFLSLRLYRDRTRRTA